VEGFLVSAIALRLLSKKARKVERQAAQGLGLPKTASIGVLPLRDRCLTGED